jgi:transcriptional regulator with XRE-family HTH domain
MQTINDRFRTIFEKTGLTQEKFANRINRSRGEVANILYDKTTPKPTIISATCDAFNVNRRYLEHGEEPMFLPELDPDTDFINDLLAHSESPFVDAIRAFMRVYMELPAEDQRKADAFVLNLREKLHQQSRD